MSWLGYLSGPPNWARRTTVFCHSTITAIGYLLKLVNHQLYDAYDWNTMCTEAPVRSAPEQNLRRLRPIVSCLATYSGHHVAKHKKNTVQILIWSKLQRPKILYTWFLTGKSGVGTFKKCSQPVLLNMCQEDCCNCCSTSRTFSFESTIRMFFLHII